MGDNVIKKPAYFIVAKYIFFIPDSSVDEKEEGKIPPYALQNTTL